MGATSLELGAIRVRVADEPPGLAVQVDGRVLSPPYEAGLLSPGPHKVMVTAPGHMTWTGNVQVDAGLMAMLDVRLTVVTAPTAGRIRVTSSVPESSVSIDDGPGHPAPFDGEAPGGHHKIVVTAPGYWRHTSSCDVSADVPCLVDAQLAPMTDSKVIETTGHVILFPPWMKWALGLGLLGASGVGAWVYLRPSEAGDDAESDDKEEQDDEPEDNPGRKHRRRRHGRR